MEDQACLDLQLELIIKGSLHKVIYLEFIIADRLSKPLTDQTKTANTNQGPAQFDYVDPWTDGKLRKGGIWKGTYEIQGS